MLDVLEQGKYKQRVDVLCLLAGAVCQILFELLLIWMTITMSPELGLHDIRVVVAVFCLALSIAVGLSIYVFRGWKNTSFHLGIWGTAVTTIVAVLLQYLM